MAYAGYFINGYISARNYFICLKNLNRIEVDHTSDNTYTIGYCSILIGAKECCFIFMIKLIIYKYFSKLYPCLMQS